MSPKTDYALAMIAATAIGAITCEGLGHRIAAVIILAAASGVLLLASIWCSPPPGQ